MVSILYSDRGCFLCGGSGYILLDEDMSGEEYTEHCYRCGTEEEE